MKALSPRLETAASLVRPCERLCDVGTDHAYLPISLVKRGVCERAIACDLRPGPLANAKVNVESEGLADRIELRLSDGLDAIREGEADEIVIAGMGGILISRILSRAGRLTGSGVGLILQPQSHAHILRAFLVENGFRILRETVCREGDRLYLAMRVDSHGGSRKCDDLYAYCGELAGNTDELSREYLTRLGKRLISDAGKMSSSAPEETARLEKTGRALIEQWTD